MKTQFFVILLAVVACTATQAPDPSVLIEADKAFSALSVENGMVDAFLTYADSEVVKLQDQQFPIWGIEQMKQAFADMDDSRFTLSWEPIKAEIAVSGDLGYTMGNWKLITTTGDTSYGNYVSVWKKQASGSWKYVLDTGTETPGIFKPE